ncbi:MAG: LacI family DNA-binding transcriptional regulator, partial [Anaerolineae bacterium]|nr:LacI family DNA-binding transcriptional regulator [Anaerolineae bacterium]
SVLIEDTMTSDKHIDQSGPPTMQDVAKLAGVSQPTVSRVLNNTKTTIPVSKKTRDKVLVAVKELGYRPNMTARSLRTQRTHMISLLVADITNNFYHLIAQAIQEVARAHDYDMLIANSDHVYENEKRFCEAVIRRPVDGVIMVPQYLTYGDLDELITLTNTPITVLGQHINHPAIDVVGADDEQATFEAITWLIAERGHKSIGYIGVALDYPPSPRRWQGFQRALKTAGLTFDPDFYMQGDWSFESGRQAINRLLKIGKRPSAIFALNDLMAIGAILALQDAGLSVPDDVAIMGFDNMREATIVRPRLTTIAQYPTEIGQKVAEALFDRIEGREPDARRELTVPLKLIVRESA